MDLREQIGQRLVIGFPGTELDPEFVRLVKEYKIGNVILFQRNLKSMEQVKALCADIQELVRRETGHDAFITIDQEGARSPGSPGTAATCRGPWPRRPRERWRTRRSWPISRQRS